MNSNAINSNTFNQSSQSKISKTAKIGNITTLFSDDIVLREHISADNLRKQFGIPVMSKVGSDSSTLFNNEMEVINRYCDYLNANEIGHFYRLPNFQFDSNKARLLRPLYVINDALKSIMSIGSKAVDIILSQNDYARKSNEDKIYQENNKEVIEYDINNIIFGSDDIVDFGNTLQHFSEEQLYNMFANCCFGKVGFGYVYVSQTDKFGPQDIYLDDKFIGVVKNVIHDGNSHLFTKFGDQVTGYKYQYLNDNTNQLLFSSKNECDFTLEIKQLDCYKLINLTIKRFVIIKKPSKMQCFDAYLGDEVFSDSQLGEVLTETLLDNKMDYEQKLMYRFGTQHNSSSKSDFNINEDIEVREVKDTIVVRHKVKGRIFDGYQDLITHIPVCNSIKQVKVSKKLLNKVTVNFINAPSLTSQLVKSNLAFINNNMPEIDIINEAIPALMYAIKDTLCVENCLLASLQSKETKFINLLKDNKIDLAPTNVVKAFKCGKLMSYLDYKLRGLFGLNEVKDVSVKTNSKLDFH